MESYYYSEGKKVFYVKLTYVLQGIPSKQRHSRTPLRGSKENKTSMRQHAEINWLNGVKIKVFNRSQNWQTGYGTDRYSNHLQSCGTDLTPQLPFTSPPTGQWPGMTPWTAAQAQCRPRTEVTSHVEESNVSFQSLQNPGQTKLSNKSSRWERKWHVTLRKQQEHTRQIKLWGGLNKTWKGKHKMMLQAYTTFL